MPSSAFVTDSEPPMSRARRRRRQRRRNGGPALEGSNATGSAVESIEDSTSPGDHSENIMRSETDMNLGGDSSSSIRGYKICVN